MADKWWTDEDGRHRKLTDKATGKEFKPAELRPTLVKHSTGCPPIAFPLIVDYHQCYSRPDVQEVIDKIGEKYGSRKIIIATGAKDKVGFKPLQAIKDKGYRFVQSGKDKRALLRETHGGTFIDDKREEWLGWAEKKGNVKYTITPDDFLKCYKDKV